MSIYYRTFSINCHIIRHITKPLKWSVRIYPVRVLSSGFYCNSSNTYKSLEANNVCLIPKAFRIYSTQTPSNESGPPPKQGMYQKLKIMYRDYWYVALPVHMATSVIWFSTFYYAVRSGVDVVALLEYIGVSEKLMAPLKDSSAGYLALTLALYKVVTPLRYAATIGGTTFAIRRLKALGWIKPVPSKERLKELYQERKDTFTDCKQHYQCQMKEKKNHFVEKKNHLLDEMRRYKHELKSKVKKM